MGRIRIMSLVQYGGNIIHCYYNDTCMVIHNETGPAVINNQGVVEYVVHNKDITDEVEKWTEERNIDPLNLSEEDQLALTFFIRSFI